VAMYVPRTSETPSAVAEKSELPSSTRSEWLRRAEPASGSE
jgi:hypothetical protein